MLLKFPLSKIAFFSQGGELVYPVRFPPLDRNSKI